MTDTLFAALGRTNDEFAELLLRVLRSYTVE